MIEHDPIDSVFMSLGCCYDFPHFITTHSDNADVCIRATDGNIFSVSIKGDGQGDRITEVYLHEFLDHADVPGLEDAVGVTGSYVVTSN